MNYILYTINYKILLFISIFNQFLNINNEFENEIFKRIKLYKKKI